MLHKTWNKNVRFVFSGKILEKIHIFVTRLRKYKLYQSYQHFRENIFSFQLQTLHETLSSIKGWHLGLGNNIKRISKFEAKGVC